MTSLAVPEEARPKEISSQTSQIYCYTMSVPCKDHYILWFPHNTPFLVEATNFTETVRFLLKYAKHNTREEHDLSDRLRKWGKKIKPPS